jgi:hypothetical protein
MDSGIAACEAITHSILRDPQGIVLHAKAHALRYSERHHLQLAWRPASHGDSAVPDRVPELRSGRGTWEAATHHCLMSLVSCLERVA